MRVAGLGLREAEKPSGRGGGETGTLGTWGRVGGRGLRGGRVFPSGVSVPWGTGTVISVLIRYCMSESCTFKLEVPVFLSFLLSMMGAS